MDEMQKVYARRYYQRHREQVIAHNQEYRKAHRKEITDHARQRYRDDDEFRLRRCAAARRRYQRKKQESV